MHAGFAAASDRISNRAASAPRLWTGPEGPFARLHLLPSRAASLGNRPAAPDHQGSKSDTATLPPPRMQRCNAVRTPQDEPLHVVVAQGSAADLQRFTVEVQDPVLGHAGAGIGGELSAAVPAQGAVGDFGDQQRAPRVRVAVVARQAGHHGDVGLGLRAFIEIEGKLGADVAACPARPRRPGSPPLHADSSAVPRR